MHNYLSADLAEPKSLRNLCREGVFDGVTSGTAMGHVQANLVILEKDLAYDFLLFCHRNPKPCPLLDVTEVGSAEPTRIAPGADIRCDLPRYRIYRKGKLVDEPTNISDHWQDNFVGFLIGCSFTFENALIEAGLPLRHHDLGVNVPMYITNIECEPAGRMSGPMVVSMRPLKRTHALRAVEISSRYPSAHGAPVHMGNPREIGIYDLDKPDFGNTLPMEDDEIPVFWACGVTPQAIVMAIKPDIAITHAPGHMFVADLYDSDLLH